MDFLNWVSSVIASFFEYLPQYAALITASVAISLFLIKEHKEKKKKEKDEIRENQKNIIELHAIRSVLGREAFSLLEQIVFLLSCMRR